MRRADEECGISARCGVRMRNAVLIERSCRGKGRALHRVRALCSNTSALTTAFLIRTPHRAEIPHSSSALRIGPKFRIPHPHSASGRNSGSSQKSVELRSAVSLSQGIRECGKWDADHLGKSERGRVADRVSGGAEESEPCRATIGHRLVREEGLHAQDLE